MQIINIYFDNVWKNYATIETKVKILIFSTHSRVKWLPVCIVKQS